MTDNILTLETDDISQARDLALDIADIIADTPASNTAVLDIHAHSSIADVFVICSGENERQLRAIHRRLVDDLGDKGTEPLRVEGDTTAGWILLDYGDVVVHIFDEDVRTHYSLEERWSAAPVILSIQ